MEKPLKCIHLLSLKEIALRKLVVILWNNSYILASRLNFQYQEGSIDKWKSINDSIKDKIMKFELPESITKLMVDTIRPIGLEIKRWEDFHRRTFNISPVGIFEQDSAKLYFTQAGTIDDRRMAQEIARCDDLIVEQRYLIACAYWLEDYIPLLWQKIPDKEFYSGKDFVVRGLEYSWPYISEMELFKLECCLTQFGRNLTSLNHWAFERSVRKGNKAAVEYFFQKLSHEEREASLMRSARNAADMILNVPDCVQLELRNVLHYLLSLLNPEQQTEIVMVYPVPVMLCYLDWSRRELFSENAGLIWPFLPPRKYSELLYSYFGYEVIHCPELFMQSPLNLKRYVLESDPAFPYFSVHFLRVFFNSEDSESIEVMFRLADAATRVKLVFNHSVLRLFHESIVSDKFHMVEVCLREITLSREDRKRLKMTFLRCRKEEYFSYFDCKSSGEMEEVLPMDDSDPRLKSFFDFLDRTDTSAEKENKRK